MDMKSPWVATIAGDAEVVVAADAVSLPESRLVMTTVATTAPITAIAATVDPTIR